MFSSAWAWMRRLGPAVAILALAAPALSAPSTAAGSEPTDQRLYLVALDGSGAPDGTVAARQALVEQQDAVLDRVEATEPVYRWTHALNGFAVELDRDRADALAHTPGVAVVEAARRYRTAGLPTGGTDLPGSAYASGRGGRGVVIGVVDSGLAPESPLFAPARGLGPRPSGFQRSCETGDGWTRADCNGKIVAARWFVRGFGEDRLASSARLSARDDTGHGTQVASLAAGNAGVSIEIRDRERGSYSGVAPQARLAVYKACWTAPDPSDDGCSTADLVSAVDRAVGDGVDVLNLSVGGSGEYDVLARSLLGAAEADVVVVAAAGSGPVAAHPEPWVTTVGATTGTSQLGTVVLDDGTRLDGAMLSPRSTGAARLVRAADAAAPGTPRDQARTCRPGSLDDRRVAGAIVVCERGSIGRVDKSAAVRRAGGAAMVLLNGPGGDQVFADLHDVPTVHLRRAESRVLRTWLDAHPHGRATLHAIGATNQPTRILPRSAGHEPSASILKPDLVAPGTGLLAATPAGPGGARWDFLTGTSGAAAQVSGLAAVLRSRHAWPAARVRSVLATSTEPVRARVSRRGSGQAIRAVRPGLAFDVAPRAYRHFLDGLIGRSLNTPSVTFGATHASAVRRVTNVSGRTRTWTASVTTFDHHRVRVVPATLSLRPGESARFRVVASGAGGAHGSDQGLVTWRAAGTTDVRVPVVLGR